MVMGFTTSYQALSLRGQWVPLLYFTVTMLLFVPFPSLTNEAQHPGQDLSVDLEDDHCCGPLIMQRKAGMSLHLDNRRRHLLFFVTDILRSVVLVNDRTGQTHESRLISGHAGALYSHCRESMCTDASS